MSLVLINCSWDTFTPTQSGAIGTHIWECCKCAKKRNIEPIVVTRAAEADPYAWGRIVQVAHPGEPTGRAGILLRRAERKAFGWTQIGQRTFAARVLQAIRDHELQNLPLVLHNDPELAVVIRRAFPKAIIIHHFHNQHECKPRFARLLAESCNVLTAVSDFTARWVEKRLGLPGGVVKTIYNGVDSGVFRPNVNPSESADGRPLINFVGRMGIEKGPDIFLLAALRLSETNRNFRIQLIGSNHWGRFEMDDYQARLNDLVRQLESRGIEVLRWGHLTRAELPAKLRSAQINVMPSRWDEPFGLVTLEGMASGLATVASRTGGTPEVVGEAGFLFEREAVEELAEKLGQLVEKESLRLDYADRARRRALEFSWDRTWLGLSDAAGLHHHGSGVTVGD